MAARCQKHTGATGHPAKLVSPLPRSLYYPAPACSVAIRSKIDRRRAALRRSAASIVAGFGSLMSLDERSGRCK
jgi:hypothetical protein